MLDIPGFDMEGVDQADIDRGIVKVAGYVPSSCVSPTNGLAASNYADLTSDLSATCEVDSDCPPPEDSEAYVSEIGSAEDAPILTDPNEAISNDVTSTEEPNADNTRSAIFLQDIDESEEGEGDASQPIREGVEAEDSQPEPEPAAEPTVEESAVAAAVEESGAVTQPPFDEGEEETDPQ